MAMTDFSIVTRSLTSRLFSTVTTAVTVAVSVALMLVLLSMRDAGRRAFESGSGNVDLLVSRDASPLVSVLNNIFYANPPPRFIRWDEYERLTGELPLEFAIPQQQGDSYRGFPVLSTTDEFFTKFQPVPGHAWTFAQGRKFEREFEVVVGAEAATRTGLRVGDTIYLTHGTGRAAALATQMGASAEQVAAQLAAHVHKEFEFKIVGVLSRSGGPHDRALFVNLDSSWILHAHDRRISEDSKASLTTLADVTDSDRKITGIYLRVLTRPGSDVSSALPPVFAKLRADSSIVVAQPAKQIENLFTIVGNIDRIFIAMAAVVMVSSAISIMLALYNSMEQRRRQIAVLRVLGCSQGRLFGLVLTESALLGVLGAIAGIVLAIIGGQIAASVMHERLGLTVEPTLSPTITLATALGAVILASLAGIVPAVMAYKTSVAKNLRPLG